MKLPTKGCLIDADGKVLWAWEHNDPTTEFHAPAPLTVDPVTGAQRPAFSPHAVVIDLSNLLTGDDYTLLYQTQTTLYIEQTTAGSYCFKQSITTSDGRSGRFDHPLMTRINARRRLNNQAPLPSTPDRIMVVEKKE